MVSRKRLFPSRRSFLGGAIATLLPLTSAASAANSLEQRRRSVMSPRFDRDRFVDDCLRAAGDADPQHAVKEVLASAVSNHVTVLASLGEPTRAGLDVLHRSAALTIFAAHWTPHMNLVPHDHRMWALIGIYTGREDNILWRREAHGIDAHSAQVLFEGNVGELPADAIHSVTNPLPRFTGGIHIYGGDFFATHRSQWNPETLQEGPSDGAAIRAMFEHENERLANACR